jgi:uncharacterized protein
MAMQCDVRRVLAVATVMLSILAAPWVASAASFDCKKASSRVEHIICDDPSLDSFDSQLQGAYLGALDRSNKPAAVTEDQRAWLKQRDACADAKCMIAAYQRRIEALSKISDEPAICAGDTTPEINACAAEYAHRADKELDRYLEAARKRLRQDAEDSRDDTAAKKALAGLDASQTRWLAFRKAECDAVYDWWSEGTIRGAMFEGCMQDLTKRRTEQIWSTWLSFLDDTPPLMPKPVGR